MTEEADATLLSTGSYTNEEAKFTIAGQGWGNWTVNDILNDANDLVVKTKDKLNTMFGENDQMLFGGMQAASDAGLTGIYYVAAADGAKEAYDYIKGDKTTESGEYYCTGENSPVQVAIKAVGIAKEILVDGKDMNSYDEVTLTDAVCVTKDNVDERYEYGFLNPGRIKKGNPPQLRGGLLFIRRNYRQMGRMVSTWLSNTGWK